MESSEFVTVQTRLRLPPEGEALLERFADRFGRDLRRLNALLEAGISLSKAKVHFCREGLTARQFNSIAFVLKGMRSSRRASWKREILQKERRIRAIERRLNLPRSEGGYAPSVAHQKKRTLGRLRDFVERAKEETPSLVFGGTKLWQSQHHLSENGFSSHQEWKEAWRQARSSEFFLVGSHDESFGNQSCQINLATNTLKVRLPDSLGGAILLKDVSFPYGKEILERALLLREAISYRFVRKKKGKWYLFASTRPISPERCTEISRGALGIDLGPDRIAMVDSDPQGNPLFRKIFWLPLQGKSKSQAQTLIEKVAKEIGIWAMCTGKPVVLEDLEFEEKKACLKERGKAYARMLSSFAYQKMIQAISSRAARSGVQVIRVNPAFTSVIGVVKFAAPYGLSADLAAALALARRALKCRESVPARTAFRRPEDRRRHVWSLWNRFAKAQRPGWRHAFISAKRRSGGGRREYPTLPARASPASKGRQVRGQSLDPRVGRPARIAGRTVGLA